MSAVFWRSRAGAGLARAADSLALSQPAVTKSLQELEQNSQRHANSSGAAKVQPSPALGRAFLARAAAAMVELEGAVQAISQVRMRSAWTVRVGALPSVAARLMPDALRCFKQTEPEAVVQIVTGPNVLLLEQLRNDELDLVVGRLGEPGLMTNLTFTQLYSEPVRFVVRCEHPLLADRSSRFLEEYRSISSLCRIAMPLFAPALTGCF